MNARSYLSVRSPWLMFFTIGRPISGILCILLQMTGIGWPIAINWAMSALEKYEAGNTRKRSLRDGFEEFPKIF